MSKIKFFREASLPATLEANSFYLIGNSSDTTLFDMYVTNGAGVARHMVTSDEINDKIRDAITSSRELFVVDNINERDALAGDKVIKVYVIDAELDETVNGGGATYIYDPVNSEWHKSSEDESIEVIGNYIAKNSNEQSTGSLTYKEAGNEFKNTTVRGDSITVADNEQGGSVVISSTGIEATDSLGDPQLPLNNSHLTTKLYVDQEIEEATSFTTNNW